MENCETGCPCDGFNCDLSLNVTDPVKGLESIGILDTSGNYNLGLPVDNVLTWLVFWKEIFEPLAEISMLMTKMFGIPIHSIIRTYAIALTSVK